MVPTRILEAATLHQSTRVSCACGHAAQFQSHCLWWHFTRRLWDDRFAAAKARFWCRRCASSLRRKVRPSRIEPVLPAESDVVLGWPNEGEWKRAVQRLR